MLANDLIHREVPSAVTVGEDGFKYRLQIVLEYVVHELCKPGITQAIDCYQDVSGMPTLCLPVEWGGFGQEAWMAS